MKGLNTMANIALDQLEKVHNGAKEIINLTKKVQIYSITAEGVRELVEDLQMYCNEISEATKIIDRVNTYFEKEGLI
jgi:DNA-binding PadR family transcriptional regulator